MEIVLMNDKKRRKNKRISKEYKKNIIAIIKTNDHFNDVMKL